MSIRLIVVAVFGLLFPLVVQASEIHDAVRAGEIVKIERLLKQRPNRIDLIDKGGIFTPLQIAALRGDRPVIQALLAFKADPKNLSEAMRYAVWRGEMENVQLFVGHGAEVLPDFLDSVMNNLMVDEEIIVDPEKQTTLIEATPQNIKTRLELARWALEKGADVNYKSTLSQEPPLFYAPYWGKEMVELLLQAGADVRVRDIEQRATIMHYATLTAADPAIFKLFVDKGLSVEVRDRIDRTPLAWAIRKGNEVAVRALLELGADVKVRDAAGWTPLHVAATVGNVEIMGLLLDKGAELNARTNFGWTPLYITALYHYLDATNLLLAKKPESNVPDLEGRTALAVARRQGVDEVVNVLTAAGAKEVGRLCEGAVCDFELEMRNRRKYFFDQPPKKNCVLIESVAGLYTLDILPDDFALAVGDLETGTIRGSYRYAVVRDGEIVFFGSSRNAHPKLVITQEGDNRRAIIQYRLEPDNLELEPGHLNRLAFGAGGFGDLIIAYWDRNSGLSGMLRRFLPE